MSPPFTPVICLGAQPGSFFCQTPTQWAHGPIPDRVKELMNTGGAKFFTSFAFTCDGGVACTYLDQNGEHQLYTSLLRRKASDWLHAKHPSGQPIRDYASLILTFGAEGSWYCADRRSAGYGNLESRLEAQLRVRGNLDTPEGLEIVALGKAGNWVLKQGGNTSWALDGYPTLNAMLGDMQRDDPGMSSLEYVHLHQAEYDCWLAHFTNQTFAFNGFPPQARGEMERWIAAFNSDINRTDMLPFGYPRGRVGINISPKQPHLPSPGLGRYDTSPRSSIMSTSLSPMSPPLSLSPRSGPGPSPYSPPMSTPGLSPGPYPPTPAPTYPLTPPPPLPPLPQGDYPPPFLYYQPPPQGYPFPPILPPSPMYKTLPPPPQTYTLPPCQPFYPPGVLGQPDAPGAPGPPLPPPQQQHHRFSLPNIGSVAAISPALTTAAVSNHSRGTGTRGSTGGLSTTQVRGLLKLGTSLFKAFDKSSASSGAAGGASAGFFSSGDSDGNSDNADYNGYNDYNDYGGFDAGQVAIDQSMDDSMLMDDNSMWDTSQDAAMDPIQ